MKEIEERLSRTIETQEVGWARLGPVVGFSSFEQGEALCAIVLVSLLLLQQRNPDSVA